ncbi:hypothetical protein Tco_0527744 [Tanacetum coccineum]
MTQRAVLLRTGLKPLSTAKSVYTAHPKPTVHCARPKTHFFKSAQSTVQRPFYKNPALTNRHFNHKVNTVRPRIVNTARSYKTPINTVRPRIVNTTRSYRTPVNTVRPRVVNTSRPNRTSVNTARANGFNAGKAQLDDKGFVDSGCSRHMTGTVSNDSACTSKENSQDCIVMPIWKDTSYLDPPTKNGGNSLKLNVVGPSVSTASPNEEDNTEEEPEVDLGNITNSYIVPTTPNTRIHKDHPIDNVIGEVQSTVQTRRMSKPTSKQGFLSDVYEQKTHDTLNTCLYACFLSQIEPTSIAKALSDSSWVEAMQEELSIQTFNSLDTVDPLMEEGQLKQNGLQKQER